MNKPRMTLWQVVNMNVGFLGIQFSFGLVQSDMSAVYKYLGANNATLPFLWLAGPVTGLILQPIIGTMSDRTSSRLGRRTPYFLIGAIICSLCLFAMPFSPILWAAAGLLWILDAGNNITMEPYRAFVSDQLRKDQHALGFLTQSAFTGLAQTLAYLTPSLLVLLGMQTSSTNAQGIPDAVITAFLIGGVLSIVTIVWSIKTTPELPMSPEEQARVKAMPHSVRATATEVFTAFREMPLPMRQLALMMLFQWYAMFCYWEYITLSISQALYGTTDAHAPGFSQAVLITGQIGGLYNALAFGAAFAMVPLARRIRLKWMHAICLLAGGAALLWLPMIHDRYLLFVPMLGLGVAWASMMGNPYAMLVDSIPPERSGVYLGLFNIFIVVPMLLQILTVPLIYHHGLGGNPGNVIRLAGAFLVIAAALTLRVRSNDGAVPERA